MSFAQASAPYCAANRMPRMTLGTAALVPNTGRMSNDMTVVPDMIGWAVKTTSEGLGKVTAYNAEDKIYTVEYEAGLIEGMVLVQLQQILQQSCASPVPQTQTQQPQPQAQQNAPITIGPSRALVARTKRRNKQKRQQLAASHSTGQTSRGSGGGGVGGRGRGKESMAASAEAALVAFRAARSCFILAAVVEKDTILWTQAAINGRAGKIVFGLSKAVAKTAVMVYLSDSSNKIAATMAMCKGPFKEFSRASQDADEAEGTEEDEDKDANDNKVKDGKEDEDEDDDDDTDEEDEDKGEDEDEDKDNDGRWSGGW